MWIYINTRPGGRTGRFKAIEFSEVSRAYRWFSFFFCFQNIFEKEKIIRGSILFKFQFSLSVKWRKKRKSASTVQEEQNHVPDVTCSVFFLFWIAQSQFAMLSFNQVKEEFMVITEPLFLSSFLYPVLFLHICLLFNHPFSFTPRISCIFVLPPFPSALFSSFFIPPPPLLAAFMLIAYPPIPRLPSPRTSPLPSRLISLL